MISRPLVMSPARMRNPLEDGGELALCLQKAVCIPRTSDQERGKIRRPDTYTFPLITFYGKVCPAHYRRDTGNGPGHQAPPTIENRKVAPDEDTQQGAPLPGVPLPRRGRLYDHRGEERRPAWSPGCHPHPSNLPTRGASVGDDRMAPGSGRPRSGPSPRQPSQKRDTLRPPTPGARKPGPPETVPGIP